MKNPLARLQDPSLLKTDALVNGQWLSGASRFDVTDPATGHKLADVANLGPAETRAAIAAANAAWPAWKARTAKERSIVLRRSISGLGTFEEVYRRFEPAQDVTNAFINHAHNDYLEIAVELGAPGLALIVLFLGWWLLCLLRLLGGGASPYAWAGWLAAGIILTHSGWDYPLRTAALSTVFALGCVLAARWPRADPETNQWAFHEEVRLGA